MLKKITPPISRVTTMVNFLACLTFLQSCQINQVRPTDADKVLKVYENNLEDASQCNRDFLSINQVKDAQFTLRWTVNSRGKLTEAAVIENSTNDEGLETCHLRHLKSLSAKFPAAHVFSEATVSYTFVLNSGVKKDE